MKIKEIVETKWASNTAMGMGSERPQDQRLLEKPRVKKKPKERKLKDNLNSIVGIGYGDASGSWANSKI